MSSGWRGARSWRSWIMSYGSHTLQPQRRRFVTRTPLELTAPTIISQASTSAESKPCTASAGQSAVRWNSQLHPGTVFDAGSLPATASDFWLGCEASMHFGCVSNSNNLANWQLRVVLGAARSSGHQRLPASSSGDVQTRPWCAGLLRILFGCPNARHSILLGSAAPCFRSLCELPVMRRLHVSARAL